MPLFRICGGDAKGCGRALSRCWISAELPTSRAISPGVWTFPSAAPWLSPVHWRMTPISCSSCLRRPRGPPGPGPPGRGRVEPFVCSGGFRGAIASSRSSLDPDGARAHPQRLPPMTVPALTLASDSGQELQPAFALGSLPAARRKDAMVFYAFCREIDDIADEPEEHRRKSISSSRRGRMVCAESANTARASGNHRPASPDRELLIQIIEGVEMDIEPKDFSDLQRASQILLARSQRCRTCQHQALWLTDPMSTRMPRISATHYSSRIFSVMLARTPHWDASICLSRIQSALESIGRNS